jgi:hypothetical protein
VKFTCIDDRPVELEQSHFEIRDIVENSQRDASEDEESKEPASHPKIRNAVENSQLEIKTQPDTDTMIQQPKPKPQESKNLPTT